MKLFFISLNQQDVKEFKKAPTDISAIGIRYLSSYLKSKGHHVNILFLAKPYGKTEKRKELEQINSLISRLKPDLIGFSLMSNHFSRAKKITMAIKERFETPIIWGGIHPTIKPIDCLKHADMVCVGEGELALESLLSDNKNLKERGKEINIQGIWQRKDNKVIANGTAPLIRDIEKLPYPDYDLEDQYIIHCCQLMPLTTEVFREYYPASRGDHRLISTRGCPHTCAYCCNSVFKSIYGSHYLRMRSVNGLIDEMIMTRRRFPFINSFKIMDDSFTVNNVDWMKEFNRRYKESVNLPFFCLVSPLTINKEKLDLLIDCGLKTIQIGLQSGSNRINREIYLRQATSDRFLYAMELSNQYRSRLKTIVDVIVDNPYETKEDILSTIEVLNQIKRPFHLSLYSLAFYPGTELHKRAVKDKILVNNQEYLEKEFHLFKNNYWNRLIYLIPYLKSEEVKRLVYNSGNFSHKIYVAMLFFLYRKKNKLPYWLLNFFSEIKKYYKYAFKD